VSSDFLSGILGALIGAAGAVVAALIAKRSGRHDNIAPIVKLPDDVLRQAEGLPDLKRQLLLSVRKYDCGKRIEDKGDRNAQQRAGYSFLALERLVHLVDTDSGATVVTLTKRGWQVAAAIDALTQEPRRAPC